jgi:hypothetical protein
MSSEEIEVMVTEGAQLVQRSPCTVHSLPDGRRGVLWRGVVYPLLPGNRIDLAAVTTDATPAKAHLAVLLGEQETWVLLDGMPSAVAAMRSALAANRVSVTRTGRWLGDPVDGVAYDWFLRCDGHLDVAVLSGLIGEQTSASPDPAARVAVLEQQLLEAKADLARLDTALRKAIARPAELPVRGPPEPDPALEVAARNRRLEP